VAADVKVVPLGRVPTSGRLDVTLRLARGHFRLDYLALAELGGAVTPTVIEPRVRLGRLAAAASVVRQPDGTLVTLPGAELELSYALPPNPERYEPLLQTRGYYLEWMRQEWLAEEDPARAALLFYDPRRALRELAPEFKRYEPRIETLFWSSRFAPH
jgi:hypothetical protein